MKLLILAATVLFMLPAPVGAQGYNPPGTIVVTPQTPEPGDFVRVTVANCEGPPGSLVTVFIDGIDVGTARLGATGNFSKRFRVPLEAEGDVAVTVTCENGVLSSIITVVLPDLPFEPGTPNTPDTPDTPDVGRDALPRTGSNAAPLARIGVSLMAVGVILVFAVSRRREEQMPEPRHG